MALKTDPKTFTTSLTVHLAKDPSRACVVIPEIVKDQRELEEEKKLAEKKRKEQDLQSRKMKKKGKGKSTEQDSTPSKYEKEDYNLNVDDLI